MQVFDLYALSGPVSRVNSKPGYRFEMPGPITVKNRVTGEKIQIKEFEADNTGDDVINVYTEREAEALNADDFEVVTA
ncbi:MAG: hypothetical protein HY507_00325 [Candidatus Zambryskibacteria bacterium]|nr:hypothetical protein [Candidatus Zambryskibacteria bacterium]